MNEDERADAETVPTKAASRQSSPVDHNWEEGAHAVILTILDNIPVVSGEELRARSEFSPHLFHDVVTKLTSNGLVVAADGGYRLTEPGKLAARQQRDRLIGL